MSPWEKLVMDTQDHLVSLKLFQNKTTTTTTTTKHSMKLEYCAATKTDKCIRGKNTAVFPQSFSAFHVRFAR